MKTLWSYLRSVGIIILSLLVLYLVNPFDYGYLFGYLMAPIIFIKKDFLSTNLDFDFFLLVLFSLIYAIFFAFSPESELGKQFIIIYALTPPTFYLVGKYLTRYTTNSITVFYLLLTIGFLFSFSAILSVYSNFLEGGFVQLERNLPNFWTNNVVAATLMGGYFTFNMCIPALLIANRGKKGLIFNLTTSGLFAISLICVLRLGSRTQLGVLAITIVLSLLYVMPKQTLKQNLLLFGILGVLVGYLLTHVSFNPNADWLTTFAGRMEDNGNALSGGGRTDKWIKSFHHLFTAPLGWDLREFGYSHNLWLDVARVSGIIPFAILTVYSIRSFFQIKKTVRLNPNTLPLNALILIYSVAFFLVFMVEPIFDGVFSFFVIFCLFKGIINKYHSNFLL